MNSIKKLLEILPKKTKSKLYIFIILLLISSFFELVSISALIPIAEIIINGNTSFEFVNDLLVNYEDKYTKNQIIITILIFVIIFFLLKTLYLILFSYWTNKFSQNIYKTFSEKTLEKYFSENYLFFINNKSSDLIRNIILETKNVSALTFCYLKIVVELFIFFSIGVFILIIDFKTSISLIFFFLFFTLLYYTFTKKLIFNYGLIRQESTAKLLKNLQEIFGSIKDIKLKHSENFFKNFFSEYLKMFVKAAYKSNTFNEAPRFLIELCFLIILTIIITLNISDTVGINSILPLLVVYSAAGLRLLPGFVKLNSYLQTIESYKPSLNLIYKEFKSQNLELNIKHKKYDLHGLQFHPESINTKVGMKIIENYINL